MGAKDICDEVNNLTDELGIIISLLSGYATVSEEVARRYDDWPILPLNPRDMRLIMRINDWTMRRYSPLTHIFVSRDVASCPRKIDFDSTTTIRRRPVVCKRVKTRVLCP
jgi:hypothetical protein